MFKTLLNLIAPCSCFGCKMPTAGEKLCSHCLTKLDSKKVFVSIVSTINFTKKVNATAIWEYNGFIRTLIHLYKFQRKNAIASVFAQALSKEIKKTYHGIVVVPSTNASVRARGYSHMHLIAKRVSKETKIELLNTGLSFNSNIRSQVGLNLKQRRHNRKKAFIASDVVAGKRILLLDDVVTSGHTLHSAIQSLHENGAKQVDALVLARTAKSKSGQK